MAMLATWFDRWQSSTREQAPAGRENPGQAASAPQYRPPERMAPECRIRPFPNEDIYFFVKKVDNTRVVREEDPQAPRVCWKLIGGASAAAVLLIGLLVPGAYALVAGYTLETLKSEREQLQAELAKLEVKQAELTSPERLAKLAQMQEFYDPEPGRVIYVDKPGGESLALHRPAR